MNLARGPNECGVMHPLAGETLLAAWDLGSIAPASMRAIPLLIAACPKLAEADAESMSLPARDLALLRLHEQSFGSTLSAFTTCPCCGERLEFALPASDVAATLNSAAQAVCSFIHEGYALRLRLANSADAAAAATESDLAAAQTVLLARCLHAADVNGTTITLADLPEPTRAEALRQLDDMHEAAELSVSLACPACRRAETVLLDMAAFVWTEVGNAVRQLLADVHELAWAYGWAESAILSMSPGRRRAYLEMVRS
jgi:hypothetical protein